MPSGKKVTKEQKTALVKRYNESPISISECAKLFGLSSPTVIKILDEFEIERYKKAQLFNPGLDESFFQEIDSEEKAYFLGLIIADGVDISGFHAVLKKKTRHLC